MGVENEQFYVVGDIYLDIFDENDNPTGLIGPMNGDVFNVTPNAETIDLISNMRDTAGQVRNSITFPAPSEVKMTLRDAPTDVIAAHFMGTVETISEGATTVTDEPVTAKLGKWVEVAGRNIASGSVVVTDDTGSTTFVEGTDYEVNYQLGMIRALVGGAITDAQNLLADYDTNAVSGERINAAARQQVKARILFNGKNLANGNAPVDGEVYECTLKPDGALEWLSNSNKEHGALAFTGTPVTPDGKTSPVRLDKLAA